MPVFLLNTNICQDKITTEVLKELSNNIARLLGKPESYVAVQVIGGQKLIFGGSDAPCGTAVLKSIGSIGGKKNKELSKALFPLVKRLLEIPEDRLYIEFVDIPATDIAYAGAPFA